MFLIFMLLIKVLIVTTVKFIFQDLGELRVYSNGNKLKNVTITHEEVNDIAKAFGLLPLLTYIQGIVSAFVER